MRFRAYIEVDQRITKEKLEEALTEALELYFMPDAADHPAVSVHVEDFPDYTVGLDDY